MLYEVITKERISLLYKEIANTITPKGYYLSASIPSRISDEPFNPFSDPFDYAAIGKSVDQFVVMLYNRITSYNVCYTKLLRIYITLHLLSMILYKYVTTQKAFSRTFSIS